MPVFSLSAAQERLWFLHQLDPTSSLYTIFDGFRLIGPLDVPALQHALDQVIARHEPLRTTLVQSESGMMQVVAEAATLPLVVYEVPPGTPADRQAEALRIANTEFRRPFDLVQGPTVRASLIRLADDDHLFFLTMHHITAEVVSFMVINRDLEEFYNAFRQHRPVKLPEITIQYGAIAQRERERFAQGLPQGTIDHWRAALRGIPPMLQLPTDRRRPAVQSHRGAWRARPFGRALLPKLRALGSNEGVSLFMTMLAAYQTMLHRISGQDDIVVGSAFGQRTPQTENLVGILMNMLTLRTDLSGDPSFRQALGRVRETCLEAFSHADLPFERLVQELQPGRSLSHSVLFQTFFSLVPGNALRLNLDGLQPGRFLGPDEVHNGGAKLDLHLFAEDRGDELRVGFEYATDLFEPATIDRLLTQFETLLDGLLANPDAPISTVPLLTEAERQARIADAGAPCPVVDGLVAESQCLHEIFADQAARHPNAVAVTAADASLTYSELNQRANQLAHHLLSLRIQPEDIVGICLPRASRLLVAILAVLKANGAYLPLDPIYPAERLALIAKDAAARVIITVSEHRDLVTAAGIPILVLDELDATLARQSAHNPATAGSPDHLAYVIYTSGSTGTPKGTLITHRNAARLFSTTRDQYGFAATDTWTLFHSYNFDFSIWEIFGPLLHGGRCVVVPQEVALTPDAFYAWLVREQVTVLSQTPSAFRLLIAVDQRVRGQLALRQVWIGGEALDFASLEPWIVRHGDQRPVLINGYGPTECTVFTTFRRVLARDLDEAKGSMIGRPFGDVRVYLLDRHLQPVPIGVPGELWIGGGGISRGYLRRPELNQERFIRDPFSTNPNDRLYRSGDLARWSSDLDLEYLGRADQQVKIRGFRVEIGEIEQVLARQANVREAVVIARGQSPGDFALVAYIVADHSPAPTAAELRLALRQSLPEYMVPSAFVVMPSLPLNRSGKIDRAALPAPVVETAVPASAASDLADADEQAIALIWRDLLRLEHVDPEESFFDCGGHSLLLVQLHARLLERFPGCGLSVIDLFRFPTIRSLAQVIRGRGKQTQVMRNEPQLQGRDRMADLRARRQAGRKTNDS